MVRKEAIKALTLPGSKSSSAPFFSPFSSSPSLSPFCSSSGLFSSFLSLFSWVLLLSLVGVENKSVTEVLDLGDFPIRIIFSSERIKGVVRRERKREKKKTQNDQRKNQKKKMFLT